MTSTTNIKLSFPHFCHKCRKFMLPRTECMITRYSYSYYRGNNDKLRTTHVKLYCCNSCYMKELL